MVTKVNRKSTGADIDSAKAELNRGGIWVKSLKDITLHVEEADGQISIGKLLYAGQTAKIISSIELRQDIITILAMARDERIELIERTEHSEEANAKILADLFAKINTKPAVLSQEELIAKAVAQALIAFDNKKSSK